MLREALGPNQNPTGRVAPHGQGTDGDAEITGPETPFGRHTCGVVLTSDRTTLNDRMQIGGVHPP